MFFYYILLCLTKFYFVLKYRRAFNTVIKQNFRHISGYNPRNGTNHYVSLYLMNTTPFGWFPTFFIFEIIFKSKATHDTAHSMVI